MRRIAVVAVVVVAVVVVVVVAVAAVVVAVAAAAAVVAILPRTPLARQRNNPLLQSSPAWPAEATRPQRGQSSHRDLYWSSHSLHSNWSPMHTSFQ